MFFDQQQPSNNEMSTPTPRTDTAWSATFDSEQMSAGRTARALRECSQRLETELAAERARLDWLLLDVVSRFDDAYYTRATIDAKMKEGAK